MGLLARGQRGFLKEFIAKIDEFDSVFSEVLKYKQNIITMEKKFYVKGYNSFFTFRFIPCIVQQLFSLLSSSQFEIITCLKERKEANWDVRTDIQTLIIEKLRLKSIRDENNNIKLIL